MVDVSRSVKVHLVLGVLRVRQSLEVVPCSVWSFLLSSYSVSKKVVLVLALVGTVSWSLWTVVFSLGQGSNPWGGRTGNN